MTICYLAGKYNAPTDGERLANTDKMIDLAIRIYEDSDHKIYDKVEKDPVFNTIYDMNSISDKMAELYHATTFYRWCEVKEMELE